MSEVIKATRLSKAAKEFNIGISTIIEFLSKKGFDIEAKPNTKISSEIYDILVREFQSEKAVKEESLKIGLSTTSHETISMYDNQDSKIEIKEEKEEELLIKDSTAKIEEPLVEKVETREEPAKPIEADQEETEAVTEKKTELQQRKAKEKKPETPVEEVIEKVKISETEKEKHEFKVLDKIDLEAIQKKTKPAKKTKVVEKEKKETIIKEEIEAKKTEEVAAIEEKNFIPTEVVKLSGPKILDKIELPEIKKTKKKPIASSKDEKVVSKKKKRKRISKFAISDTAKSKELNEDKTKKLKRKKQYREQLKPKISEEEVQKQIKETLSRLSPTGKSKASKYRKQKRAAVSQQMIEDQKKLKVESSIIKVTEFVTVNELATMIDVPVNEIISACMTLGLFVSINQRLDAETLNLVAEEFGHKVEFVSVEVQEAITETDEDDNQEDLEERFPIVTVMGHVDHGKTKLLDYIRNTNVIAGEAGGITQHIGAHEVILSNGKKITFLDTPGHEAFTAMRARGTKITDVVIIVIAADDSVMPQTKEAINHAQAAGVPIVFAINKIDKNNANPDKIKQDLSEMNILIEEWGGKYQSQDISAKTGLNVDLLLEKVLLEAELLELKGNPNRPAVGCVIESSLDKGRGYITKLLIQNGTLRTGDIILTGSQHGKVKAMYNEKNQIVKEAGLSTPILMLGLNGAPQAGDVFNIMHDEKEAKSIAAKRLQLQREQGIRTQKHITLDEIGRRLAIGDFKELNLIVKGDVDGSVEALSDSLLKLSTKKVQVNIIHKSVGAITESDVLLASASNAIIIGFQVRPVPSARKLAEHEQIDIRLYSIIYQAIEEIKSAIEGMLSPEIEEKVICTIEVRETYKITKVGTIAGCMVLDGKITRNSNVHIIRDGIVIYTGGLGSLKRFKDDVKEVQSGYECGLNIENFNDIKVSDIIEGYVEVEVKQIK
jgi:translation initiation factor IF-2